MLRTRVAFLVLLVAAGLGGGCGGRSRSGPAVIMNPAHLVGQHLGRILVESHQFHLSLDRLFFGIDYPGGEPESTHQQFYGMVAPGAQPLIE